MESKAYMEKLKKLNKGNAISYLCARQSRVAGFLNFIVVIYNPKLDPRSSPYDPKHKHKENNKHFAFLCHLNNDA